MHVVRNIVDKHGMLGIFIAQIPWGPPMIRWIYQWGNLCPLEGVCQRSALIVYWNGLQPTTIHSCFINTPADKVKKYAYWRTTGYWLMSRQHLILSGNMAPWLSWHWGENIPMVRVLPHTKENGHGCQRSSITAPRHHMRSFSGLYPKHNH